MPTPLGHPLVDTVQSVGVLSPTTALLLGVLIGIMLGVAGMFWLKRKHVEITKE